MSDCWNCLNQTPRTTLVILGCSSWCLCDFFPCIFIPDKTFWTLIHCLFVFLVCTDAFVPVSSKCICSCLEYRQFFWYFAYLMFSDVFILLGETVLFGCLNKYIYKDCELSENLECVYTGYTYSISYCSITLYNKLKLFMSSCFQIHTYYPSPALVTLFTWLWSFCLSSVSTLLC